MRAVTLAFVPALAFISALSLSAQSPSDARQDPAPNRRPVGRAGAATAVSTETAAVGPQLPQRGASSLAQGTRLSPRITPGAIRQVAPLTTAATQPGKSAYKLPILFSPTIGGSSAHSRPLGPTLNPGPPVPTATFEPRIEVDSFGLAWQTQARKFAGVVELYIVDTLNPNAPPVALPSPIVFHVTGDGADVDPESPQITSTNMFAKINVSTARMDSLVRLHVTPYGLTTPIDISLRLARAPLVIALGDTMPGLGFGRREAMISFPAGFSGAADSIDVSLTADNGSVSPEHVWVSPVRPGHVIFRSGGLRDGTLSAAAVGFSPSSSKVAYAWPIGFFIASLAGVIAGAIAVVAFRKRNPISRRSAACSRVDSSPDW